MNKEEFIIKFYSCDDEEQFLKDVYHNLNCLQQENEQLKIQISAREEEYKKLEDNWNYIKKMLKEARQEEFNINGYCGTCTDVDIDFLLDKMHEIEGSDSNE